MSAPEHHFNPELATPSWRRRLKASEPGRILAAVYRRRRLPLQVLRAQGGFRRKPVPPPTERRRVRAVCWIAAGPGASEGLLDTWASAAASSPGDVALVVTDDWTQDCDRVSLQRHVPDAVVVRPGLPTGGPPRLWPITTLALKTALTHFDFDLLIKLDSDALVVGPDWIDAIAAAIDRDEPSAVSVSPAEPQAPAWQAPVGVAGAFRERPDGERETDEPYHRRVLSGELPHDAVLAGWAQRAREAGWPDGAIVQGGCLVMTSAYCEALVTAGAVAYRPRLRTIVSEDLLLTLLAYALGFRAASLGGPAGPLAIANKHLPLPLDELLDPQSRWVATHSTRVGLDGEPESVVRDRAAAMRAQWARGRD